MTKATRAPFVALVLATVATAGFFVNDALAGPSVPAPTITSSPTNPTTATTATFDFSDTEHGVTFKCSLDSSVFAPCSSGITYDVLALGSHTLFVETVSGSTTSASASADWTIVPPTPTIISGPGSLTADTSAFFTYGDGRAGVSYRCSLDGSPFTLCPSSGATYEGLSDGSHTFFVEAQYGSGPWSAPASYPCRIDRTPPTITVTYPVNLGVYNAVSWTGKIAGTASDPLSPVKSVTLAIEQDASGRYWNGSSFSTISPDFLPTTTGTASWSYPLIRPSDGLYRLYARATDGLGNTTSSTNWTTVAFSIDTATPRAPIISEPANPSTVTGPEFQFTDANWPVIFHCQLDSGAVINCTGDTDHDGDTNVKGEWQYSNLAIGPHCFYVYAVDEAGKKSPATPYCWTIISKSSLAFTISGNITPLFYPGTSHPLDLVFTNPNSSPITIAAGAINISISTTQSGCSFITNFAVSQGLTVSVTVPADSTRSLAQLSIIQANWPVISMIETHTNQDACEGAPLTFTYSSSAT